MEPQTSWHRSAFKGMAARHTFSTSVGWQQYGGGGALQTLLVQAGVWRVCSELRGSACIVFGSAGQLVPSGRFR